MAVIEFFESFISQINVVSIIDIAIIAFIIYKVLEFIRETRAEQLVKGLIILLIVMFVSGAVHLYALNFILKNFLQFGIIALVIVFQPELRRALEYIGRSQFLRGRGRSVDKEQAKASASAITDAVKYFSANKTGALIIVEREVTLNDYAETGVTLDSALRPEILENIFYEGAPLHDGAAIIQNGLVHAAACVLPLTRSRDLPPELGMRHRAGIGITEVSDAFAIIVSEETGIISTAQDGKLTRFLDVRDLEKTLLDIYLNETMTLQAGIIRAFSERAPEGRKKKKPAGSAEPVEPVEPAEPAEPAEAGETEGQDVSK
ncbi:MAG: diadenylate cyclase CdaA [Clostridiales Family XIII bacterium]|jgi:diadenylate cyclase|nr:diadenylate cyclase CdaA [Clostridiales Family XIII bacterium]